ncbi:hypothetical protein GCM10010840_10530 [Deinococcus aerolatus]|uniref:Cupin type-2 domain-containing protein n=1 Tax=Deinococcus aerolatus TaxID=522487 RepID=A0ABQ2G3X9_9DEIO|nr:cupin domain-containing protein [Deinococcus aerolatus]GGL74334.1 hypothetical protein GCM10010840_10530 [Deinococcus aerolatus]
MTTEQPLPAPDIQRAAPPQVMAVTPGGRSLLFTLEPGQGIPPHRHPGSQVLLAVLSGEVEVRAPDMQVARAGEVLVHDGDGSISLLARQSAQVLVTLLTR